MAKLTLCNPVQRCTNFILILFLLSYFAHMKDRVKTHLSVPIIEMVSILHLNLNILWNTFWGGWKDVFLERINSSQIKVFIFPSISFCTPMIFTPKSFIAMRLIQDVTSLIETAGRGRGWWIGSTAVGYQHLNHE